MDSLRNLEAPIPHSSLLRENPKWRNYESSRRRQYRGPSHRASWPRAPAPRGSCSSCSWSAKPSRGSSGFLGVSWEPSRPLYKGILYRMPRLWREERGASREKRAGTRELVQLPAKQADFPPNRLPVSKLASSSGPAPLGEAPPLWGKWGRAWRDGK